MLLKARSIKLLRLGDILSHPPHRVEESKSGYNNIQSTNSILFRIGMIPVYSIAV